MGDDIKFITHIISEICKYAKDNGLEPDNTLEAISKSIIEMLKISTFNSWTESEQEE